MKPLFIALLLFAGTARAQEDKFLAILKSEAPLKDKADACQELGRVGTRQAVPVLAALLADEQLSHRARSALETIADPSVDAALRQALGRLQGPSLAGVIQSLGIRKDAAAVEPLAGFLSGTDPIVARATARALGHIGGAAVPALERALSNGSPAIRLAVCEGLFRCAETMAGPPAASLYDRVQALPDLPHHVRLAAFSGAVRSRRNRGVPLMLEAIRTGSPVPVVDAVRVSMDLLGAEVTQALVGALGEVNEETQILLLQTLGDRGDATAARAMVRLAQSGSPNRRIAAIQNLVRLHDPVSLQALTGLLGDTETAVASAALTGLAGWPGPEADSAVMTLLNSPERNTRIAALEAAGQRRIRGAVPALLKAAEDADGEVASAAFETLGQLGGVAELPDMVIAMLKTPALADAELALSAVCERQPEPMTCADKLLPGLGKAKGEAKLALLRVLGGLGGPQALDAMRVAANDPDEPVRETAWRALCDWPTVDALPDLVRMTRSTAVPQLRTLALRGQLRLIPMQTLTASQRVGQIQELLPTIEQLKEQRLALSTLGGLPCPESLALVVPYLSRSGFEDEAGVAAVSIAEKIVTSHPAEVAAAMPRVQTKHEQLAARVRQVLSQVPAVTSEPGFTPIFNGRDLTGWEGKPGAWRVEDGALTAESTPENPCLAAHYLIWRGGEPSDFELIADFRLSAAGNSGIQLRSRALPNWDTSGYQADMSGDGSLVGFVYEHTRGLIAGRGERVSIGSAGEREVQLDGDAAELLKSYRKEAWNTYRIDCRGPEITLWINGKFMCQFTDRDTKQAASRGIIALQMHPGPPMKVQFRNIRLKTL